MLERLLSWLPEESKSSGREESNEPSAAENHQGHEIQDRAGARRNPVGLPQPLETACWVLYTCDRRGPAPDAEAFHSRDSTQRVNKSSATEPWQTLDEVQTTRKRTERDKINGQAPDGREENGGPDRFSPNLSELIKTITPSEPLGGLAEQLSQPPSVWGECGRALKRDAQRERPNSPHFRECLPAEGDIWSLEEEERAKRTKARMQRSQMRT